MRRNRRRFWNGDPAALATLHECLDVVTRLLAPFTPFITDRLWQALVVEVSGASRPDSVGKAAPGHPGHGHSSAPGPAPVLAGNRKY